MLAQAKPRLARSQRMVQQIITTLPPVRGINSTGSVADMPPEDAIEMDNFISTDLGVVVRGGWYEYATGIGVATAARAIRTIMSYEGVPAGATVSTLASSQLFAATDSGIFDIEGGGNLASLVPDIVLSGAPNAGRFSSVMFTNTAGQFLAACSETDGAFIYNGTAWHKGALVTTPATPWDFNGIDPAQLVQCCLFKRRIGYVQRASTFVWFSATNSTSGVMVPFDFGPVLPHGGAVLAVMNWTQDDGVGMDDRLVVLGTSGDLAVYEGTDPASPTTFRLIGTWYIGPPPIGRRCFTQSGGQPMVLTTFGVIPVGQIVQGGLDTLMTASTEYLQQLRKLQNLLNSDFASLLNTLGWEMLTVPDSALLFIARPSLSAGEWVQYAFQQHNLAWSRLVDMPCGTFGRRLNELYGGTEDGRVLRLLAGTSDGVKLDGTGAYEIRSRITPAFNHFGNPAVRKQALMMRVNFVAARAPGYALRMNVDYAGSTFAVTPTPGASFAGSFWDMSLWDAAYWAGGRAAQGEWRSVEGLGYALAPTIYVSSIDLTTVASIEYMTKAGGPL